MAARNLSFSKGAGQKPKGTANVSAYEASDRFKMTRKDQVRLAANAVDYGLSTGRFTDKAHVKLIHMDTARYDKFINKLADRVTGATSTSKALEMANAMAGGRKAKSTI